MKKMTKLNKSASFMDPIVDYKSYESYFQPLFDNNDQRDNREGYDSEYNFRKDYIQNIITVIITAIYNTKSRKWVCNYSGINSITCKAREFRRYVEYFLDRNIINELEVRKELRVFF